MRRLSLPLISRPLRYLSVGAVAGVLFYFSILAPPPITPPSPDPFWDKKLHFGSYVVLTLSLAYATVQRFDDRWKRVGVVLTIALLYGVLLELTQGALPRRYFSLADLLANGVGVVLASSWFVCERSVRYVRLTAFLKTVTPN